MLVAPPNPGKPVDRNRSAARVAIAVLWMLVTVVVLLAERLVEDWAELNPYQAKGDTITLLLYAFLVRAPLEMATAVVAMVPFWQLRRRSLRAGLSRQLETRDGITLAVAAALGFITVRNLIYLVRLGDGWLVVARVTVITLVFVLLCGMWGWVLGRRATRGVSGRRFSTAWLLATVFAAVCDQLVFGRSTLAMVAVTPVVVCLLVMATV